jgi:hypothetical protein
MATIIQQPLAATAVSDQHSLVTSLPARFPGTAVSVMGPCRPAAVPVMGRDRGTAGSVMGPCRPAAIPVMGRDRGTATPVMGRDRGTAAPLMAVRR